MVRGLFDESIIFIKFVLKLKFVIYCMVVVMKMEIFVKIVWIKYSIGVMNIKENLSGLVIFVKKEVNVLVNIIEVIFVFWFGFV